MDMLEVKDLSVKVDGKLILKDLNFNLAPRIVTKTPISIFL
jgi:Fe-S cluster assembly ATPase SufC